MTISSNPYGWDSDNVLSGGRLGPRACQYWTKGLSGICQYWENGDPGNCTYEEVSEKGNRIYPSGWNNGHCDFLGRRTSCNKYEPVGEEDLDQYICVAPNPFITGLIKDELAGMPPRSTGKKTAVPKSDIKGYNADGKGVGQCDKKGQGKGKPGAATEDEGHYKKLPVICLYYRPWHMGFGAIKPKTTDKTGIVRDKDGHYMFDGGGTLAADERDELEERLPLSLKVFNVRAKVQRCAYWDRDYGSDFILDAAGLYLESDEEDKSNFCTCVEAADYCTVNDDAFSGYEGYMLLENVWSKAGSVVCNGAKPECPYYTGKWVYCIDEKLEDGDKVSAEQIMELRFWMADWSSQKEYDEVFERRPNPSDTSTTDIYTYEEWEVISSKVDESILKGKKIHMCMPKAYWSSEFSDDYLTRTDIVYEKNVGTQSPTKSSFPTLIRDLEFFYGPPVNIIYPYPHHNPFDVLNNPICDESDKPPCIKKDTSIDGTSISVIGNTIRGKVVYVVNLTNVISYPPELDTYESTASVEQENREAVCEELKKFVENMDENYPYLLFEGESNSDGFYSIGPVPLNYQQLNKLVVVVVLGDDWIFRRRDVWAQWYGGITAQTNFTHRYGDGVWADDGYSVFTPPASAQGHLYGLQGGNPYGCVAIGSDTMSVYSYRSTSLTSTNFYYAYCIKKITKEKIVNNWIRIDAAGTLWIEIDDLSLNYVFASDIIEAKVIRIISNEEVTIELEKVLHSSAVMPPNAWVLRPKNNFKVGFLKSDNITLTVKYWYYEVSTNDTTSDTEEIIFPTFDFSCSLVNSPYTVVMGDEEDENNFTVSHIQSGTVKVLGLFVDEDGRLVSAMATKFLVDVARVLCRDVEIYYSWSGSTSGRYLYPSSGWYRNPEDGPFQLRGELGSSAVGFYAPVCGDHDVWSSSGKGPMWFPYDTCEKIDYYSVYTGANFCCMPFEGPPGELPQRDDYRMCGPIIFEPSMCAFTCASDCCGEWACKYTVLNTSSVKFTGYARRRGRMTLELYNAMGWALPRFGNVRRDYIEKFRSMDCETHLSIKGGRSHIGLSWMPYVMTDKMFYFSFNSFDTSSETDLFNCVNQLNFVSSTNAVEIINYAERLRFEDIFGLRRVPFATYPPPLLQRSELSYPFVVFYYFLDDKFMWAWQEYWKPIERGEVGGGTLTFVKLGRLAYLWDVYKMEYRIITEEGSHILKFKAPEIDYGVCEMVGYPSLQLDDGPERFFEVVYPESDYISGGYIKWQDEGDGTVGGSGGSDGPGPYETARTSSDWLFHEHMLFDGDVTIHKIITDFDEVTGEEKEYKYRTGIAALIDKIRLKYLPYTEFESDWEFKPDPLSEEGETVNQFLGQHKWYEAKSIVAENVAATSMCVSKIVIKGFKGAIQITGTAGEAVKYNICTPGVEIYGRPCIGGDWEIITSVSEVKATTQEIKDVKLNSYESVIKIPINPLRMITKRSNGLRIVLNASSDQSICIDSLKVYEAEYIDFEENIFTFERRYNVSRGEYGSYNPDGAEKVLSFEKDLDNSGIYYNEFMGPSNSISCINKMRAIYASEEKPDMDSSGCLESISTVNQVYTAEEEQEILYRTAYNKGGVCDQTVYNSTCPSKLYEFLSSVGASFPQYSLVMNSERRGWEQHPYGASGYTQYDLWHPKGHYYVWSKETRKARCWWVSPEYDVMWQSFVHAHSPGAFEEMPSSIFYQGVERRGFLLGQFITKGFAQGWG